MTDEGDIEFLRAIWSRRAVITYALFAANILVFILMQFAGGSTNDSTLLAFGVKWNAAIDDGEIWRFITPIFIHIGLLHLFFNSYALWIIGPQVEKLYGASKFFIFYVLTGIGGVAASYWYHPDTPSAGASGAIFGLFGVLLVFGFRYRNSIPQAFRQALGKGILITVGINLLIGFTIPVVDNSAHLGGLITGGILAAIIPFGRPGSEPQKFYKFAEVLLAMVVAVSFFQVAAHYNGPRLSFRNFGQSWGLTPGGGSSIGNFVQAINATQNALENSANRLTSSNPGDLTDTKAELAAAIDQLQSAPSLSTQADELTGRMLTLLERQQALIQDIERDGSMDFEHRVRADNNARTYERLITEFEQWLENEGSKYGIVKGK